ncbi:uncharacterized protein LOC105682937 isoform X2 [Athalia rosae]|uniref:uncharacterized protein LOC105682937 isoform X2 n=1 Tax=Athalia rosae TaxID=37344 RepID=UPI002033B7F6|nr:uncharacterized protein LOC105682937 isoform X2 [Athalia rosae]
MDFTYITLITLSICAALGSAQIYTGSSSPEIFASVSAEPAKNEFLTQTVYGFLDFTTTIGNTVMVFSPQSAPPEGDKAEKPVVPSTTTPPIQTKPAEPPKKISDIQPSKTHKAESEQHLGTHANVPKETKIVVHSVVEQNAAVKNSEDNLVPAKRESVETHVDIVTQSPVVSSVVEVRPVNDVPNVVKNDLVEPEYDFLSKQPTEVVDETYKLINLRPSSKHHAKPRPTARRAKDNPTGLVTKLGGTIVKDGLTTVHETNVIGTYINGKYAQVLQSSSHVLGGGNPLEGKIKPTNSQRILKTIGPQHGKLKPQLEPTPPTLQDDTPGLSPENIVSAQSGTNIRTSRRHSNSPQAQRPKFRNNKFPEDSDSGEQFATTKAVGKNKATTARPNYKNRSQITTTTEAPVTRRRNGFRPNNPPSAPGKQNRPKIDALSTSSSLSSLNNFPKVEVDDDSEKPLTPEASTLVQEVLVEDRENKPTPVVQRKVQEQGTTTESEDPESRESENVDVSVQEQQILPVETLNVEISTPADFNDIYFEIATIKSPYTFQAGNQKNTRYVTVTSTLKKSFATAEASPMANPSEPLTENILANTGAAYETTLPLDSSVATLPAISLDPGQATPPLETITETFSTTQTLLKTHLLPVVAGGNTTKITLVQTYHIARIVTATKTLPPMELYQFIPSKTLNEFNSKLDEAGSELHLELDFGDDDREDDDIPKRVVPPGDLDPDSDLFRTGGISPSKTRNPPDTHPSVIEPQLSPEQAQQLALYKYFGQQQAQVITTSRPVVVVETVYESHVIPLINNGNTVYSTLSRPVATLPRTTYEYGTSTIAPLLPPQVPQPLFPQQPQQQPQFTVTTAPFVTQTVATLSDSRVLKLTFGAKTAYTTLFTTRVVPTEVTTYLTSTVAVQPTVQAFPGYFPPPVGYPPYPFVG